MELWSMGCFLEEQPETYGARMEGMQAAELISLIREAQLQLGIRLAGTATDAPSLVITKDFRIFIGGSRSRELRMRPMSKAVFLLFLRHPEGIEFKQIRLYRTELESLYRRLSRKGSREEISRCVERVLEAGSREVNIAASRVAESLSAQIGPELLPAYVISGERGGVKRICLDRRLVVWQ